MSVIRPSRRRSLCDHLTGDPEAETHIDTPSLNLIVAMDRNRVIGADGSMPWHIPGDLRWFKQQTLDKPILMGRRTFESIGRPLPRRRNLVLSRRAERLTDSGIEPVASLDDALERTADVPELMIIGGAEIYRLTLPMASRLIVTEIDDEYRGDTFFPEVDWRAWSLIEETAQAATDTTPAHRFAIWQRRAS